MMDRVVPGGVAGDLDADGAARIEATLTEIRGSFPQLVELYDNTASLQDRTAADRHLERRARAAVRRRRLCRPRLGPRLRCAQDAGLLRPTTGSSFEVPVLEAGDVNARVWVRIREVEQSLALIDQMLAAPARRARSRRRSAASGGRIGEGLGACGRLPRRRAGVGAARRRPRRALPPARPVLVPMAAAGGRDRGQHRRRLPALQQVVQLLLLGTRSLEQHAQNPAREPVAPAADRAAAGQGRGGAGGARRRRRARRAPPARPQPVDPRGRRRLVQRLRAGDPCAQQRVLRPGALRPALRRLAAPCRRAAGDRTGDQEHARGAGAHLQRHARPEMGGGGRRLRARRRHLRRQLRGGRRRRGGGAGRSPYPRLPAVRRRNCSRVCWPCSTEHLRPDVHFVKGRAAALSAKSGAAWEA